MDNTIKRTVSAAQNAALDRGRNRPRNGDDTDGGRPPLPPEKKLKKGNIYLYPAQWAAIEARAALWGCSTAEALRVCVAAHLNKMRQQNSRTPTAGEQPVGGAGG